MPAVLHNPAIVPVSHWDAIPDAELLALADRGQSQAFGHLYDRHKNRVLNTCWQVLQDRHDAEDAASIVFVTAWRHRRRIRLVDESALPWLVATSVNVCRTLRRTKARHHGFLSRLHPDEPDDGDPLRRADERLERRHGRGPTWAAFRQLSEREQVILVLCVVEELPQNDVAAALGIAPGTVKSRLSRAKERLRRQLATNDALDTVRSLTEGGG